MFWNVKPLNLRRSKFGKTKTSKNKFLLKSKLKPDIILIASRNKLTKTLKWCNWQKFCKYNSLTILRNNSKLDPYLNIHSPNKLVFKNSIANCTPTPAQVPMKPTIVKTSGLLICNHIATCVAKATPSWIVGASIPRKSKDKELYTPNE